MISEASNESIKTYVGQNNELCMDVGFDEDRQSFIATIDLEEKKNINFVTSKEDEGVSLQIIIEGHFQKSVMRKVEAKQSHKGMMELHTQFCNFEGESLQIVMKIVNNENTLFKGMRGKQNQHSIVKEDGTTLSHTEEPIIEMNKTNLAFEYGQTKSEE